MIYFAENFRKYRLAKGLTQEDVANLLSITPQSVSKWERRETYPDITLLPALANILDTSIDLLVGMDEIRAEKTLWNIHSKATNHMRAGEYAQAEKTYREALTIYPSNSEILLGLASVLALGGDTEEAIAMIEKGLPVSQNEKQKATMRATLCFLYARSGQREKAEKLASELPHTRESREAITPIIERNASDEELERNIRIIILGE